MRPSADARSACVAPSLGGEAVLLRCALCHDDLAPGSERRCGACGTLLHAECAANLAGCPTLGCARRARAAGARRREAVGFWSPLRLACVAFAGVLLIALGVAAVGLRQWMAVTRPIVDRNQARARLSEGFGVDLASVTSEARALHARLAPSAVRAVAASELPGFPAVHDAARGGVVAWPDGVVLYLDDAPYLSTALVVLARPEGPLSPAARERLAREVHLELAARFAEVEPGVHLRTLVR